MKIPTGIIGLDSLTDGGIEEKSICAVVGESGTGKTIFALQFVLQGLRVGDSCIYLTLEQSSESIKNEAVAMGWHDIDDYLVNEKLFIYETDVDELRDAVKNVIPKTAERLNGKKTSLRIVIDSITPLIWHYPNRRKQREILKEMYLSLRKIATTLVVIEQHGNMPSLYDETVSVPVFLSDAAVILKYNEITEEFSRSLRVLKQRGSYHGDKTYNMQIVPGFGICVYDIGEPPIENRDEIIETALSIVRKNAEGETQKYLIKAFETLRNSNPKSYNEQTIELILREFRLVK